MECTLLFRKMIVPKAKKLIHETNLRFKHHGIIEGMVYAKNQFYYNFIQRQIMDVDIYDSILHYDEDWDLLIVLDACRVDALRQYADDDQYDFIDSVDSKTSVSGRSPGWMREMFDQSELDKVKETTYVTANPHSELILNDSDTVDPDQFQRLDEVWKYGWDKEKGTVLAETMTDRAINLGRSSSASRMIVHYMQPHFPSVPKSVFDSGIDLQNIGEKWENSVWEQYLRGRLTKEEIWEAYNENLKYVLESLDTLLHNIDADKCVITADHGNAFGEKGYYGHGGYPVDAVREVPWCETVATDSGDYQPQVAPPKDSGNSEVKSRLESLGYI